MFVRTTQLILLSHIILGYASPSTQSTTGHVGKEPDGHEFCPAKKTDSRAPCPGLNAMANHGWLPRNGKNISYPQLRDAAQAAYNYTPDTYRIFFDLTTQVFNISTTPSPSTSFNLEDLKAHRTIEQDGSLSRNDVGVNGDDLHFNSTIWHAVARDLGLGAHTGGHVSNRTAAEAYIARQLAARQANPTFVDDCFQRNGTQGTTSLYLAALWDHEANAVPKKWIEPFFVEERIPYKEGYTAPRPKDTNFIHDFVVTINDLVNEVGGLEYFDPDTCPFATK